MDENTFDSSSLKCYINCPRKYFWRYVEHLQPQDYDRAPLDFGTAMHEALRVWYENKDLDEAIDTFHLYWDERWEDKKRTHEKGETLLKEYVDKYGENEPWSWISPPEEVFKIDLFGANFVGRFDGVIHYQDTMPLIIDHKTATRMGSTYFKTYRPDLQMSAYTWAARQLYDYEIEGAMINVLYFTTRNMDFERQIINREDWELQEFLNIASDTISEIKALDRENYKEWRPNWDFCKRWGVCKFRPLCVTNEPYRTVEVMYKREEWNPLEEFDIEKKLEKKKQQSEDDFIRLID